MPITRQQFELGIDHAIETRMWKLAAFLEEQSHEAYSLGELWAREFGAELPAGYRAIDRPLAERQFVYALDKLVEAGVIVERRLGPTTCYTIGRVPLEQFLNEDRK